MAGTSRGTSGGDRLLIGAGEISKRAGAASVDARTVERDYILAHVASGIAEVAGSKLVLKGGTSLRLAHFGDYRFSADLDYSAIDLDGSQARGLVATSLDLVKQRSGLPHLELVEKPGDSQEIAYVGPLLAKPRGIKLDIALDEPVIEPEAHLLRVAWRDLEGEQNLHVYSLREVCAEKLRCVIQRRQCRDAYDLWVLVEREQAVGLANVWPIFEVKAKHKTISASRFFEAWVEREPMYRQEWARELAPYIGKEIPMVEGVMRQMNRRIGDLRREVAR